MRRKWNINILRQYVESFGDYSLLDDVYIDSETKMSVHCGKCENIFYVKVSYLYNHPVKCPKCSFREMGKNKTTTIEFVRTYISENRSEYVFLSDQFVKSRTKYTFYHKVCNTSFDMTWNEFYNSGQGCHKCAMKNNGEKRRTKHSAIFEYANTRTDYEIIEIYYEENVLKLRLFHKICEHIFNQRWVVFRRGGGCPKCGALNGIKNRTHSFEKVVSRIESDDEYRVITNKENYINVTEKITLFHKICGESFLTTANAFFSGVRCSICSESKSEREIRSFLGRNNIRFDREKRFLGCRKKYPLPFDFYLPDYNLAIEADGIQHFAPIEKFGGNDGFIEMLENDSIKNKFCKDNNIPLLRIPYWDFDRIDEILTDYLGLQQEPQYDY